MNLLSSESEASHLASPAVKYDLKFRVQSTLQMNAYLAKFEMQFLGKRVIRKCAYMLRETKKARSNFLDNNQIFNEETALPNSMNELIPLKT